jgi:hypothetical protein
MEIAVHGLVWGWCSASAALWRSPGRRPLFSLATMLFGATLAAAAAGAGLWEAGAAGAGQGLFGFALGIVAYGFWRLLVMDRARTNGGDKL